MDTIEKQMDNASMTMSEIISKLSKILELQE